MGNSESEQTVSYEEPITKGLYSIRLKNAFSQLHHVLSADESNEQGLSVLGHDDGTGNQKWWIDQQPNGSYKIYTYTGIQETNDYKQKGKILYCDEQGRPAISEVDNGIKSIWKLKKFDTYLYEIYLTNQLDEKYLTCLSSGELILTSKRDYGRRQWYLYPI